MLGHLSKSFLWTMLAVVLLLLGLILGLLPELQSLRKPALAGEIRFPPQRPVSVTADAVSRPAGESSANPTGRKWSLDWLWEACDKMLTWEKNPWKIEPRGFGSHYFRLLGSNDPADQARMKELIRLADALYRKMLDRYPELATTPRSVQDEQNGFLKLLELAERHRNPKDPNSSPALPPTIDELLKQGTWHSATAREVLQKEKSLVDEIRRIGLMPERSMTGIEIWRCGFHHARYYKTCAELLLADARINLENGHPEAAVESIRAANGIASHVGEIETPSLLATTVQILIQSQIRRESFATLMPALASGQVDIEEWENAVFPKNAVSGDLARVLKGEWNVTARYYLLPIIMDAADPLYPRDPAALLDAHASYFLKLVEDHEGVPLQQLESVPIDQQVPTEHLSYRSRQLTADLAIGLTSWRKGWLRVQHQEAFYRAAFSILKGEPPPVDPVHGLPYRGDAATRTLSMPDSPEFKEMDIDPITVLNLQNLNTKKAD